MASFKIEGGHLLSGTITPQGAKNEALQVICASLLTSDKVTIHNIPDIRDVNNLIQLLKDIGVKVTKTISQESKVNSYTFQADALNMQYLESDEFVEKCAGLRGSVLMIGPLLARMGKATVAKPGGDKIGRRRLDTHFLGFKYLGAKFHRVENRNVYEISSKQLTSWVSSIWVPSSIAWRIVMSTRYHPNSSRAPICCSTRPLLQVLPISSWLLSSQKALPLFIMLPVNHIFSNSATC